MAKKGSHGANYTTKEWSFASIELQKIREKIRQGLKNNKDELENLVKESDRRVRAVQLVPPHPGIPSQAGWAYLINKNDEEHDDIVTVIQQLARLRKMTNDGEKLEPIYFNDEPAAQWGKWIDDIYFSSKLKNTNKPPKYVLIIGDPDMVPLKFQAQLSTVACVGRLDIADNIENLKTYIKKLQSIEEDNPIVTKETIFFATNHGLAGSCYHPTYYTHHYIEEELAKTTHHELGFNVKELVEKNAKKPDLITEIKNSTPCFVFASALGMSDPERDMEHQKKITGAMMCEGKYDTEKPDAWLFTASDVDNAATFLKGGIFFQYGDFGYGAPAINEWIKWFPDSKELGIPPKIADTDFISALPKSLVFHKNGPIAYIGHFGQVLVDTFGQHEENNARRRWKNRREPFQQAISDLLRYASPVGYAFESIRDKLNVINSQLVSEYEDLEAAQDKDKQLDMILDTLIMRSELQNYMIFGDPAAGLRFS